GRCDARRAAGTDELATSRGGSWPQNPRLFDQVQQVLPIHFSLPFCFQIPVPVRLRAFLPARTACTAMTTQVSRMNTLETAAMDGLTLSRMPSHMRRGKVTMARPEMKSVTTNSSHERMKANNAPEAMPVRIDGRMTCH